MLSRKDNEETPKKRGRPRKNQSIDNVENGIGHATTDSGDAIPLSGGDPIYFQLPKLEAESILNTIYSKKPEDDEKKPLEMIEEVHFYNGNDKLTIRFSKKHNRMFRVQIFLNDSIEVRPVTYTGARTGYSFWNLLKGAMKK